MSEATPTESPAHGYSANRDPLLKRLRRIEGQVGGLVRMVEEDRYCVDLVTQINAVRAAPRRRFKRWWWLAVLVVAGIVFWLFARNAPVNVETTTVSTADG